MKTSLFDSAKDVLKEFIRGVIPTPHGIMIPEVGADENKANSVVTILTTAAIKDDESMITVSKFRFEAEGGKKVVGGYLVNQETAEIDFEHLERMIDGLQEYAFEKWQPKIQKKPKLKPDHYIRYFESKDLAESFINLLDSISIFHLGKSVRDRDDGNKPITAIEQEQGGLFSVTIKAKTLDLLARGEGRRIGESGPAQYLM